MEFFRKRHPGDLILPGILASGPPVREDWYRRILPICEPGGLYEGLTKNDP